MSFTRAKPAGFIPGEPVTAAQANQIDLNQSRAYDSVGGGTYSPGADTNVNGSFSWVFGGTTRVKIGSGSNLQILTGGELVGLSGGTMTLPAGFTANITAAWTHLGGTWPLLSNRTVRKVQPHQIAAMSQPLWGSVLPPSSGSPDGVTAYVMHRATVGDPAAGQTENATGRSRIRTKPVNNDAVASYEYFDWPLTNLPRGTARLDSVEVRTIGFGAATPDVKATYQLFSQSVSAAPVALNAVATQDAHTYGGGNWTTTEIVTTVTPDSAPFIDDELVYFVRVRVPVDDVTTTYMDLFGLTAVLTASAIKV